MVTKNPYRSLEQNSASFIFPIKEKLPHGRLDFEELTTNFASEPGKVREGYEEAVLQ
jgi:hypothetical protein